MPNITRTCLYFPSYFLIKKNGRKKNGESIGYNHWNNQGSPGRKEISNLERHTYNNEFRRLGGTFWRASGRKDYISFHTQLKTYIKRTIERIERKETKHLLTLVDLDNVKSNSSVDKILDNNKNEKINEVLNTLSERDRKVVVLHLGMYDGKPKTFNQIAKLLHIGPSRAHQIYVRAIGKLRAPQNSIKLVDYNV